MTPSAHVTVQIDLNRVRANVSAVRAKTGPDFLIVTPGIRLPGGETGDQARITTPEEALRDGANHLVVGRPINAAKDPKAAAEAFLARISAV